MIIYYVGFVNLCCPFSIFEFTVKVAYSPDFSLFPYPPPLAQYCVAGQVLLMGAMQDVFEPDLSVKAGCREMHLIPCVSHGHIFPNQPVIKNLIYVLLIYL